MLEEEEVVCRALVVEEELELEVLEVWATEEEALLAIIVMGEVELEVELEEEEAVLEVMVVEEEVEL